MLRPILASTLKPRFHALTLNVETTAALSSGREVVRISLSWRLATALDKGGTFRQATSETRCGPYAFIHMYAGSEVTETSFTPVEFQTNASHWMSFVYLYIIPRATAESRQGSLAS